MGITYPYIITRDYLPPDGSAPDSVIQPLGHGLFVALVVDLDGMVRNVTEEELKAAKIPPEQAHRDARANLLKVFESQEIPGQLSDDPCDSTFILLFDHWLAAACSLLPALRTLAIDRLQTDDLIACLPERDSLYVFPRAGDEMLLQMKQQIASEVELARKPLSLGFFALEADGLRAIHDELA